LLFILPTALIGSISQFVVVIGQPEYRCSDFAVGKLIQQSAHLLSTVTPVLRIIDWTEWQSRRSLLRAIQAFQHHTKRPIAHVLAITKNTNLRIVIYSTGFRNEAPLPPLRCPQ
jgi:hypothetical protein